MSRPSRHTSGASRADGRNRRRFIFVGIARDEQAKWTTYLEKNNMDWPQYLDSESRVIRLFRVEAYPTYIVLDGDGIYSRAQRTGDRL